MPKLSEETLAAALLTLPGWHLSDGKLVQDFTFPDFGSAMSFVNEVAILAESADHHPDIDIRCNKVRLALFSHDTGGITQRDFKLASAISERFGIKE